MDKVVVVSADGHAEQPPELWAEYLESEFHEHLPAAYEDNEIFLEMQRRHFEFTPETMDVIDTDQAYTTGGASGAWDLERRLIEMDREGVAAEFVFAGGRQAVTLFAPWLREYSQELIAAGRRAWERWVADMTGPARRRFLLTGDPSADGSMDETLARLDWMSDHGFAAAHLPGTTFRPGAPPLHDPHFEPFWSKCSDLGLALVVHAGYGSKPGRVRNLIATRAGRSFEKVAEPSVGMESIETLADQAKRSFALSLAPRRAMWQMMLGGVFDRYPQLKLFVTEVRADWIPATLHHLDATYSEGIADFPARHTPSEYWSSNCQAGLSFMHRSEAEMRHEIGVETITFGRDYPHREGTWPNTMAWIADLFAGIPEDEVRSMLGENAIRFLGLDRSYLESVAAKIGPDVDQVAKASRAVDERLVAAFEDRGGYLKPAPQVDMDAVDAELWQDFAEAAR